MKPEVSVLIATFNSAKTVRASIESVLSQVGCSCELLIADGGSRDGTVEICEEYTERLAYFTTGPDEGVYDAWNKLLPKARGDWVCFIGSDDVFSGPEAVARLLRAAQRRPPGVRVVYGRVRYVNADGSTVLEQGRPWEDVRSEMDYEMSIPHVGTLHHHQVFKNKNYFDPAYKIAGDYALLYPECKENGAYFASDVLVAIAGWGGISTHTGWALKCHREVGRIQIRNSGMRFVPRWIVKWLKIHIRAAVYRWAGDDGLARYERFKAWVGVGGERG